MDFYPTLLELAGLPPKPQQHLDGISIVPLLRGHSANRGPIFWHYPHYGNQGGAPGGAVHEGNWKLIEWYEDGRLELFDLSKDIGERYDLSQLYPDKVTDLHSKLKKWRVETKAVMPAPNPRYKP